MMNDKPRSDYFRALDDLIPSQILPIEPVDLDKEQAERRWMAEQLGLDTSSLDAAEFLGIKIYATPSVPQNEIWVVGRNRVIGKIVDSDE